MKVAQIAMWTGALIALSAQCADAEPALATTDVNLRQGPGTNYPIIDTIPGGSTVEVGGCQGQWCSVVWRGRNGFAIATSLDQGQGPPNGGPPPGGGGPPPYGAGGPPGSAVPPPGAGGPPPPGATAEGPVPAYPPGAQPPPPGYYGPPPPGYYAPPPGYYDPYYYGPGPYYGPYYGPYWRRRW